AINVLHRGMEGVAYGPRALKPILLLGQAAGQPPMANPALVTCPTWIASADAPGPQRRDLTLGQQSVVVWATRHDGQESCELVVLTVDDLGWRTALDTLEDAISGSPDVGASESASSPPTEGRWHLREVTVDVGDSGEYRIGGVEMSIEKVLERIRRAGDGERFSV